MRITKRRTEKNKEAKGVFKSAIKKTREAISAGKVDEAKEWLKKSMKSLDKASQKKVIKKNTAARKIGRAHV